MRASEVLDRYAAGERNFQRVNLRGQSFKGKSLSGADFSEADIRSTNFTNANLKEANFTGAKCGLQKRWITFLTIISWLMAAISGYFSIFATYFVSLIFDSHNLENQITGWFSLLIIVVFLILTIRQGAVAGAISAVAVTGAISAVAAAVAVAVAVAVTGAISAVAAAVVSVAISVSVAAAVAVAGAAAVSVAVSVAVAVVAAGAGVVSVAGAVAGVAGAAATEAVAGVVSVAAAYIAWRAMKGDVRDAWLRSFAIAFAAIGGTRFRGADLTTANFTGAKLKSTDFRKATLTDVRWYGAKMIDRVRPGDTYLKSTQVRQWLLGKGLNKNFNGQKLQGINLQGANLSDASFIDANLSDANLQDADLSRAKLVQTQLDRTDFTGATLTGACIEDWGITSSTKLDNVKCEYVFMRLPTEDNPEPCRKPDNRSEVFEDGDFADFIKPIFDTLDLYHNQGVDPRAIAISWKQLAENNPDAELCFASMEVKGEDNLLLRLKTAPKADLSKLNAEYFDIYNQIKALTAEESKKVIAEKDNRIQALESMVNTALNRPGFYAEQYNNHQNHQNHQGDNEMAGDRNIHIGSGNYNERIDGNYVQGNYYASEQKQTLAEAAAEIQKLLNQLEKSNPNATVEQQQAFVDAAVSPTLKAKFLSALQAGWKEAIKEFLDNSYVNVGVAILEGWQEAE